MVYVLFDDLLYYSTKNISGREWILNFNENARNTFIFKAGKQEKDLKEKFNLILDKLGIHAKITKELGFISNMFAGAITTGKVFEINIRKPLPIGLINAICPGVYFPNGNGLYENCGRNDIFNKRFNKSNCMKRA